MIGNLIERIQGKVPKGSKRSKQWPEVRAKHLQDHPQCMVCGGTQKLQVHHRMPFHLEPSRELDPTNLITLCENRKTFNCHLLIGHLGNYRDCNPSVDQDAAYLRSRFFTQP